MRLFIDSSLHVALPFTNMVDNRNSGTKRTRLVGTFIRERRETLGLSQRALGQLFQPAVTTQFISNVERGVTPLPPIHVATLAKALLVPEEQIMNMLEQEYAVKLSDRLGKASHAAGLTRSSGSAVSVAEEDLDFMRRLYDAYQQASPDNRKAFTVACEDILDLGDTVAEKNRSSEPSSTTSSENAS